MKSLLTAALATTVLSFAGTAHAVQPAKADCPAGLNIIVGLDTPVTCDLNSGDTLAALITRPDELAAVRADGRPILPVFAYDGVIVYLVIGLDF